MSQTTPLAKAITTLEGQIVTISTALLAAGGVAKVLPAKEAAIVLVVEHVALIAQRGVLKLQASKTVNDVLDSPAPLEAIVDDFKEYGDKPPQEA